MLVDRTYGVEELRALIKSFGYRILSERNVQDGTQICCDKGVKVICYDSGTVLPQGRGRDALVSLLNDSVKLDLTRNRVLVVARKRVDDAQRIIEYLKPNGIVGIPINLDDGSVGTYSESYDLHRPFCQVVLFVGTRVEFEKNEYFERVLKYFKRVYLPHKIIALTGAPLKAENSCLEDIEAFVGRRGFLYESIPDLIGAITARMDVETRRFVRTAMQVAA